MGFSRCFSWEFNGNHLLTHQLSGGGHWDDELPMKDGDVQCSISWVGGSY